MSDITSLFSANAHAMRKSVIRELLKLTNDPGIISFAGGLPAPETFPAEDIRAATDRVLSRIPAQALQYGTTEGDNSLREQLAAHEAAEGLTLDPGEILITTASQQALDILPKLFLDPGDAVIVERPTYVGAIQAIQSYRGRFIEVPFAASGDGMDLRALESNYARALQGGIRVKYLYVIPDFQNPSGLCWSLECRRAVLEFSYRHKLPIVEDAPYRRIRVAGSPLPSLFKLDRDGERRGNVIMLKTFSKILAPGMRVGWVLASPDMISRLVVAKQAMDLCTGPFPQKIIAEYLSTGKLEARIAATCALYGGKRDLMLDAFSRHMPKVEGLRWTRPDGGLFLWLTLPDRGDTDRMFHTAIARKVAYVVGSAFYADHPRHDSMRINFSYSNPAEIEEGVMRLAEVIRDELAARPS